LKLDFSVPEKYSQRREARNQGEIYRAGDDATHDATVMATKKESTLHPQLKARAVVKNKDAALKPGAFAMSNWNLANTRTPHGSDTGHYSAGTEQAIDSCENGKANCHREQQVCARRPRLKCSTASRSEIPSSQPGLPFLKPGTDLKFSESSAVANL